MEQPRPYKAALRASLAYERARLLYRLLDTRSSDDAAPESGDAMWIDHLLTLAAADGKAASELERLCGGTLVGATPVQTQSLKKAIQLLQEWREAVLSGLARVPDGELSAAVPVVRASVDRDRACIRSLAGFAPPAVSRDPVVLVPVLRAVRKSLLTAVALIPPGERSRLSPALNSITRVEEVAREALAGVPEAPRFPVAPDSWAAVWRRFHDVHHEVIGALSARSGEVPGDAYRSLLASTAEERALTTSLLQARGATPPD